MGQIADLSDLVNKLTGGASGGPESVFYFKLGRELGAAATTPIAGKGVTLWRYEGMPGSGATPTTAFCPSSTTSGALYFTNASAGMEKYLTQFSMANIAAGTCILYDRLFHIGGLNGTTITAQTIQGNPATPAITRNVSGNGNFMFYEIYTIIGTVGTTITVTYVNQNGTMTSSVGNIGATNFREQTRAEIIPLANGDTGVQSVSSIRLTASTTTAGNFGIVIGKPLAYISNGNAGGSGWRDFVTGLPGIPKIPDNACLAILCIPATALVPNVFGCLTMVNS